MKVTFVVKAEGSIKVEIPDDKLPELEALLDEHEGMKQAIDPFNLPPWCGVHVQDLPDEMTWEVDDIWWKGQKS